MTTVKVTDGDEKDVDTEISPARFEGNGKRRSPRCPLLEEVLHSPFRDINISKHGSVYYWLNGMKPFALATLAGASCLLSTYSLTREGSIPFALMVVAIIGAASGVIAVALCGAKGNPRISLLTSAFVIGALISEVVAFTHYYLSYGYHDPKLNVGVAVSVMEFGVISIVGGLAMLVAALMIKSRIIRRFSEPPSAAAEL